MDDKLAPQYIQSTLESTPLTTLKNLSLTFMYKLLSFLHTTFLVHGPIRTYRELRVHLSALTFHYIKKIPSIKHQLETRLEKTTKKLEDKADMGTVRRAISKNTILLAGSAINYPHGIMDDIEAMGKLA
ncbi:hypothetical protein BGX29_003994 [Mortierella sp. GBA35]|nr:hypothetical protein BGX29_003994 [Mortierella sp. GBA35]